MIVQKISPAQCDIVIAQYKKGVKVKGRFKTLEDFGKEYNVDRSTICRAIHKRISEREINLIKKKRAIESQYNRRKQRELK